MIQTLLSGHTSKCIRHAAGDSSDHYLYTEASGKTGFSSPLSGDPSFAGGDVFSAEFDSTALCGAHGVERVELYLHSYSGGTAITYLACWRKGAVLVSGLNEPSSSETAWDRTTKLLQSPATEAVISGTCTNEDAWWAQTSYSLLPHCTKPCKLSSLHLRVDLHS